MNPARTKVSGYTPQRTTIIVLVHIPHFSGYFADRLEILKLCLASIAQNTDRPYDLLVFDNGSSEEVRAYLRKQQESGVIHFLLHSAANIGKIGALQLAMRAAPGELIAYCDDDFYMFPGWLTHQQELLDGFPNVGMVSGYAVPTFFKHSLISSTLGFARSNPETNLVETATIPSRVIERWALSTGRDPAEAVRHGKQQAIYEVEYRGRKAFATANHDQFLAPKAVLVQCLPNEWSGQLMGEMIELDSAINQQGYLKLTTITQTTQHLGNRVNEGLISEVSAESDTEIAMRQRRSFRHRILKSRPVRFILLGIYSRLFHLINPE
jgi:glycosyltransferase involved in cell wall biosynthesis